MTDIPVIPYETVLAAVPPSEAIERVRLAFVRHAEGSWRMPPKVYLPSPPFGDFRAMPASGDGIALLKWVTSFPGNPGKGLPTVTGTILVSDSETGEPLAIVDGRSVTALRTGAAAAVATIALARSGATRAGILGCGLHGSWAGRCLVAAGFTEGICSDPNEAAATDLADELGWKTGEPADVLACDVVTTVTPGHRTVVAEGDLREGAHLNAVGADGPDKAEMDIDAVIRCRVFCDEWEQASHGGEIHGAVAAGRLARSDVTELGRVLSGAAEGRSSAEEITLFDSTGLAIQDLAIAHALLERLRAGDMDVPRVTL